MTPAELADAVTGAVAASVDAGELSVDVPDVVTIERPRHREHGDYASNVALQIAKAAGRSPREVAEILARRLREASGVRGVEVAGPGFLNITLDDAAAGALAKTIVELGHDYGRSDTLAKERVNLEFVSANPTGPLHIGGVRWAAVGDALARLLDATGHAVTREYYFNDAGEQIGRFARSLLAVARGETVSEDGYAGAYVGEIAAAVTARRPGVVDLPDEEAVEVFRVEGVDLMFDEIKRSLADFGVHFDVYFSERTLHDKGELDAAVDRLRAEGHVYEADGATWLRTTDFGDDKDRVLRKSDGAWTYFAADCAYYLDKRERGFERCIYLLGADHHGYIGRLRAMAACFGDDPARTLEVLIGQLVNLLRGGEPVRMSKRAGDVVTLEDLVEAIGPDAGRYALARASMDSAIDIDLDLWAQRTNDNPVFYVQYAHARTCNVVRNAAEVGITLGLFEPSLLTHPTENDLLAALADFPRVVTTSAELREPHRVARYLEELAGHYHRWYDNCRVIPKGDEPIEPVNRTRAWLNDATRVVLATGLDLLGVSAPERM